MDRTVTYQLLLLLAVFSLGVAGKKSLGQVLRRAHRASSTSYSAVSVVGPDSAQNKAVFESIVGQSGEQDIVQKQVEDRSVVTFMLTDSEPEHLDQRFQRIGLSDGIILVVSAIPEEFENAFDSAGGVADALNALTAFDVTSLCVLVTGMDDPSVNFSQQVFDEIKEKIVRHLRDIRFFNTNLISMIPLSSTSYSNLLEGGSSVPWYSESSLADFLTSFRHSDYQRLDGSSALSVIRIENVPDSDIVITGKILSGSFANKEIVKMSPTHAFFEVRSIWDLNGNEEHEGSPGQVIKFKLLQLRGSNQIQIEVGSVLISTSESEFNSFRQSIQRRAFSPVFLARITFFNDILDKVESGTQLRLHSRGLAGTVNIAEIRTKLDVRTGRIMESFYRPTSAFSSVQTGSAFEVVVEPALPYTIESKDFGRALSRAALTDSDGRVVGTVLILREI